ncbi:MAG: hypothetical protein II784_06755 [Oscillospiraceae bacterium]|nr:hypothetical protein [Oscillospiraceae bacterium]
MRKIAVILLIMALLFSFAAGCAGKKAEAGAAPSEDAGESPSAVLPDDGGEGSELTSLWDARVTCKTKDFPSKAFNNDSEACAGISPDGKSLLMINGAAPSLWNIESGKRTYLTPANDDVEEMMRELTIISSSRGGTEDQLEKAREKYSSMRGKELAEAFFSAAYGRPAGPRVFFPPICSDGNYMLVYDTALGQFILDCDTGKLYAADPEYGWPVGVYGSEMLIQPPQPEAVAHLMNMKTGKISELDFSSAGGFKDGAAMKAVSFMPGGGVCAVLRDKNMDIKNGEECVIAVRENGKKDEIYSLGRMQFNLDPDVILCAGKDFIVAYSRAYLVSAPVYLIDRRSGDVSVLSVSDGEIKAARLDDCVNEGGALQLPEGAGDSFLFFFDCLSDGETLICMDKGGRLILFRPALLESRYLLKNPDANAFPSTGFQSGNHYDLYWLSPKTYVEFNVKG